MENRNCTANINASSYDKGINSESCAINILIRKGYSLLTRRLKTPYGEIDAILKKGKDLIAVEVKQRKRMRQALGSISERQQARISNAFLFFISTLNEIFENYRIDVVCFDVVGHAQHIENAFYIGDAA
jgi:putative endonuclease